MKFGKTCLNSHRARGQTKILNDANAIARQTANNAFHLNQKCCGALIT